MQTSGKGGRTKRQAPFSRDARCGGVPFSGVLKHCCAATFWTAMVVSVAPPNKAGAESYRLYREVSQAWAARGFAARPSSPSYIAPGTPRDPWGPYIKQSAKRFAIPETWIRAVMHQESGGKQYLGGQLTTSGAGAMGLMQLMPATYADMQSQYNLGSDPYDPHDNIIAGAAYIRLMYDKYGAPGFLAAYNAGPSRVDDYLSNGRPLPDETVNYVAAITPNLGGGVAVRGDWAPVPVQQTGATSTAPESYYTRTDLTRTADGCLRDPNAEYDPTGACLIDRDTPHPDPVPETPAPVTAIAQADSASAPVGESEPEAGNTYGVPQPAQAVQVAALVAPRPATYKASALPLASNTAATSLPRGVKPLTLQPRQAVASVTPAIGFSGHQLGGVPYNGQQGTVQVGAFSTYAEAKRVAEKSTRVLASRSLHATPAVRSVQVSGKSFYRAQLVAENRTQISGVCQILHASSVPCIPVKNG